MGVGTQGTTGKLREPWGVVALPLIFDTSITVIRGTLIILILGGGGVTTATLATQILPL